MHTKIISLFVVVLSALNGFAQQLPLNTCGIVNVYDAAGNRTKRQYFCNNGAPYPARMAAKETETVEFQQVDALYPNPTTGRFFITFSKALQGAAVSISDINGKVVTRFKASGHKVDFDLSSAAAGVYFIRIEDKGNIISKKVIKQ